MNSAFNDKSNPLAFVMSQLQEQMTKPGPAGDYAFRLFLMLDNYRRENEPAYARLRSMEEANPNAQWLQDARKISKIMYGNTDLYANLNQS